MQAVFWNLLKILLCQTVHIEFFSNTFLELYSTLHVQNTCTCIFLSPFPIIIGVKIWVLLALTSLSVGTGTCRTINMNDLCINIHLVTSRKSKLPKYVHFLGQNYKSKMFRCSVCYSLLCFQEICLKLREIRWLPILEVIDP